MKRRSITPSGGGQDTSVGGASPWVDADEEGKPMQPMMRRHANQNGAASPGDVSSPLSFQSGEGGEGGAQRGSAAGAAVTRLVSRLEAFDGRKTEQGGGWGGEK